MAATAEDFEDEAHELATHQNGTFSVHRDPLGDSVQQQLVELGGLVLRVHQLVQLVVVQIHVNTVPRALVAGASEPHERLEQQQRRGADFGLRMREQIEQVAALRRIHEALPQIVEQKLLQLVTLEAQLREQQARPALELPQRRPQVLRDQLVHLAVAEPNPRRILREARQRQEKLHSQNILVARMHLRVAPQERKQKLREVLQMVFLHLRVVRHQTRP